MDLANYSVSITSIFLRWENNWCCLDHTSCRRNQEIQHCQELWCRSKMAAQILHGCGFGLGHSWRSNLTPSLGTSIWSRCGPKKQTNKQTNKKTPNQPINQTNKKPFTCASKGVQGSQMVCSMGQGLRNGGLGTEAQATGLPHSIFHFHVPWMSFGAKRMVGTATGTWRPMDCHPPFTVLLTHTWKFPVSVMGSPM